MAQKKDLVKLAKSNDKKTTEPKKTNPDNTNDRDLMIKKRVEKLIDEIPLLKEENKNNLLELDSSDDKDQSKNIEWLQEQVDVLTQKNEKLEKEAEEAKENYKKLFNKYQEELNSGDDGDIKGNISNIFNELNKEYLRHSKETRDYTQVNVKYLLEKFLTNFSFLLKK